VPRRCDDLSDSLWDARPRSPALDIRGSPVMHIVTATDEALAEVIEAWLHLELPGDEDVATQMAHLAMSFRSGGATIDDTCNWTRLLVRSWPPHRTRSVRRHLRVVAPSGTS